MQYINKIPRRYPFLTLARFSENTVMSRLTSLVSSKGVDSVIRGVLSLTRVSYMKSNNFATAFLNTRK